MIIKYQETTTSTNDAIKELDQNLIALWSDEQTEGRGQRENKWESERAKNITFSIMCKPTFLAPERQFLLSKAISNAVVRTLTGHKIKASVKWPNDVYVGDKKICGILIECRISGAGELSQVIIGVGLNINQEVFYSDAPNPTSMKLLTGKEFSREEIIEQLCANFEVNYAMLAENLSSTIDKNYLDSLYRKTGYHTYEDAKGQFKAKIKGVNNYGALLLLDKSGTEREYQFKEVSFVL